MVVTFGDFKKKTEIQKKTCNPKWNEKLSFKLLETPSGTDTINFKVLDYDRVKKSESLGEANVSYAEVIKLFKKNGVEWFPLTGKRAKGARIRLGFNFIL